MSESTGRHGRGKRFTRPQKVVIIVALVTLGLGLVNGGRAVLAVLYSNRLPDLPMTTSWTYLAVRGAVWGTTFIVCTFGLALLRPWGRWMSLLAAALYQVNSWFDHLLLDASDFALHNRPRDLVLTVFFLVVVWGSLNWSSVRRAFGSRRGDTN